MPLDRVQIALADEVEQLKAEGRAKAPERVIVGYEPPGEGRGPRYRLEGSESLFLRMNSNSYLSLSHHPRLIQAADEATHRFGVGPGAVRFIDGTFAEHVELERRIARFVDKPAAKIFNSAYTANLGLALTLSNKATFWVGDELNHNCIIRGMRIANVPRGQRSIYAHNDMDELRSRLEAIPEGIERVIVIFDGIFSMRGDCAPLAEIEALVIEHHQRFPQGVISVVDDSHGIGAFGATGRGTEEHSHATADVMVGTFGKAFGVNGGFVAGSKELIEAVRPAASAALSVTDSPEGRERLEHLHARIAQFRRGVGALGIESIPGPHPVVPLMIRDTEKTKAWVQALFERGVLVVGLAFPVVPKGDDTIRVQINAAHTEADIEELLAHLAKVQAES